MSRFWPILDGLLTVTGAAEELALESLLDEFVPRPGHG
jgi:hypothetical protein